MFFKNGKYLNSSVIQTPAFSESNGKEQISPELTKRRLEFEEEKENLEEPVAKKKRGRKNNTKK